MSARQSEQDEMTYETRHTPAPWMAFVEDGRTFIGTEQPGTTPLLVAEVWNDADAALLLAAPEMETLLRDLVTLTNRVACPICGARLMACVSPCPVAGALALLSSLDQEKP